LRVWILIVVEQTVAYPVESNIHSFRNKLVFSSIFVFGLYVFGRD
jgi:hypothetical protein